uniref:complement subcomponent C1r n=1 Tax=Xenopus tropicalis TaxID=8364 RepID=A0A6I8S4A6_XENTR
MANWFVFRKATCQTGAGSNGWRGICCTWLRWVVLLLGTVAFCQNNKRPLFGTVTSPNYPIPYPNSNKSTWDITVPAGYHVSLSFLVFDIEPSENCYYDFVKVMADGKELGQFCGPVNSLTHPGHRQLVSLGNQMRIHFQSDFSNELDGDVIPYKGFQAFYHAVDKDECAPPSDASGTWTPPCEHVCHNYVGGYFCSCFPGYNLQSDNRSCKVECSSEMFTEESGFISSPGYPEPYPPDLKCNYSIRLEEGLQISLSFQEPFEIDHHPKARCPYDILKVFAGDTMLNSFCGSHSPGMVTTRSHTVDIVFETDDSGDSKGWSLHYTSEAIPCPYPEPRDTYTIISPEQNIYRMRDYIVVTCQTGYKLMEDRKELSSFSTTCQKDGTWHRPIPRCDIVTCEDPPVLTNGQYTFLTAPGRLEYRSAIQYRCNAPYYNMVTPNGSDTYTCSAQRQWKDDNGGVKIPLCLPVCGKPDNSVESYERILNGKKAAPGNFPWQVFISINGRAGGALIGERWVLTAAHVLLPDTEDNEEKNLTKVHVFMGSLEVKHLLEMGNHPVEAFYVHPAFRKGSYDNDIALIQLKNPVVMSQGVSPICLPSPEDEDDIYQNGRKGYASGYGVTEKHTIANELRYVYVPVASWQDCETYVDGKKKSIKDHTNRQKYFLSKNMFCAGFPEGSLNKGDSCQGDSGGAYTTPNKQDTWVATGLVSWGFNCGQGYGIYTKVSNYVDWIKSYTEEEE